MLRILLTINGREEQLPVDPWVTLLDLLRERLNLTGTKKGCDHGQCGACTVLVDGRRINSCLALAVSHDGAAVTTVEGLARAAAQDGAAQGGAAGDGDAAGSAGLHPLQAAFVQHDAFQCGYCTPGQICSAAGLIAEGHARTRDEVRELMSGNLCRCGAYANIADAILDVMGRCAEEGAPYPAADAAAGFASARPAPPARAVPDATSDPAGV